MAGRGRNEKRPELGRSSLKWRKSAKFSCNMAASPEPYQVHTEAHGPHWVAWITRGTATKPDRSVLLVARTQEEAEARARRWADSQ
jgi:hypothetical protein